MIQNNAFYAVARSFLPHSGGKGWAPVAQSRAGDVAEAILRIASQHCPEEVVNRVLPEAVAAFGEGDFVALAHFVDPFRGEYAYKHTMLKDLQVSPSGLTWSSWTSEGRSVTFSRTPTGFRVEWTSGGEARTPSWCFYHGGIYGLALGQARGAAMKAAVKAMIARRNAVWLKAA